MKEKSMSVLIETYKCQLNIIYQNFCVTIPFVKLVISTLTFYDNLHPSNNDKYLTCIVSWASLSRSLRTSRLFSLSSKATWSSRIFLSEDSLLGAGEELRGRDTRPGEESSEYTDRNERVDGRSRRGVRSVRLLSIVEISSISLMYRTT